MRPGPREQIDADKIEMGTPSTVSRKAGRAMAKELHSKDALHKTAPSASSTNKSSANATKPPLSRASSDSWIPVAVFTVIMVGLSIAVPLLWHGDFWQRLAIIQEMRKSIHTAHE
ncbi:hypothetical protein SeMB42_g01410 [Synchytrium endobioticum]|uniref:Uncharacterized protein n=1 Tax=Synchytrium endobioticum TaxID=286115 RepID=A0A507DLP1_9FUNG|nr:hypothetical protein SeLEV6574_g00549 [Synchytrium endobioticum]TPX52436.1 hypothetical protein SeMB42_g01410 [Synchytrium endobioticum]